MRRGVAAQTFIYILAVIVFAVIILVGYRAITGFLEKGEQVSFAAFKSDMERAVNDIYGDFGSVVVYDNRNPLRLSGKFDEVCFLDLDRSGQARQSDICDEASSEFRPLLCAVWKDANGWRPGEENVFLFPPVAGSGGVSVYKIWLDTNGDLEEGQVSDDGWLCTPVISGKINLRIEGRGDHAFISPVQNG